MRAVLLRSALVLAALAVGCGGDDPAPQPKPVAPVAPTPPPDDGAEAGGAEAAADTEADPLADARAKAWAGDTAGAVEAFRGRLSAAEDDAAAWQGLVAAARSLGSADAVSAALDGVGAESDRALVLAEWHLAHDAPDAAISAASGARADQPDAVAAVVASAVAAGAAVPGGDDADDADPEVALAKFVGAANSRSARGVAEVAKAVAGWRAALARAEAHVRWGELDEALKEYEQVVASGEPAAIIRGEQGRSELAVVPRSPVRALDSARWAAHAARQAIEGSDVAAFEAAWKVLQPAADRSLRPDWTAEVAAKVIEAAGDATQPELRLALARAALAAGDPVTTVAQADALKEDAKLSADAAWLAVWAQWELRDADAILAAAEKVSGPRGRAARSLAKALQGDVEGALGTLPSSGLSDREFVYLATAAARVAGAGAEDWLGRAVRSADRTRDPALRIETRLLLESALRVSNPAKAATVRRQLAGLVPEGEAGVALKSELAARELLASGTAAFVEGELPGAVKAWRSLAENQAVTVEGPAVAPIAAWAAGRAAVVAGERVTSGRYAKALEQLPLHRYGWLGTTTVLDGSHGVPFDEDLALLAQREPTPDVLGSALQAHEVAHILDRNVQDSATGRDILAGMDSKARAELLEASAAVRGCMIRWLAGAAEFPEEALKALEAAEEKAAADSVFRTRVLARPAADVETVRKTNKRLSVLSYAVSRGKVHGLVITPDGGAIKDLGKAAPVVAAAEEHHRSLRTGAQPDTRASHAAGNALRLSLLDPYTQELSGQGWYAVLGPQVLRHFLFTSFPEQASGLRWLADIRTVAVLDSASRLRVVKEEDRDPERFRKGPDFLAFTSPAPPPPPSEEEAAEEGATKPKKAKAKAKAKAGEAAEDLVPEVEKTCVATEEVPGAARVANRYFEPDFRESCVGSDASRDNYFNLSPNARFIHIDSVPATPDGGFALGDGDLDLTTIRSIPLVAQLVIVTAEGTPEQQQARARAFLDAGAEAVVVLGWPLPEGVVDRMMDGFWASVKRDRPIARAAAEGRDSLMRDALLGEDLDNPGLWGAFILYATP